MEKDKKKQAIKLCVLIFTIIIILVTAVTIMLKYEIEGDKNMPFNLSKMVIVSTAEGKEKKGNEKWNFDIIQNNDFYFYIDKNYKYHGSDTYIEKVRIENIQVIKEPKVGQIKAYMPNSVDGRLYSYDNEYIIEESLEYKGGAKSNSQTLEIGSQGGNILIRFSNTGLGKYTSNDEKEILHDGTLLKKIDLTSEDINFAVSFDFVLETKNGTYSANIQMDMPVGDIIENGTASIEKDNIEDIIFKRQ